MFNKISKSHEERKAFPVSEKIKCGYRTIGSALSQYEQGTPRYSYRSVAGFSEFREGVAFVGVEMLDSYLEDLLNHEISDEYLFISRDVNPSFLHTRALRLGGVMLPIALFLVFAEEIMTSSTPLALFVGMLSVLPLVAFCMFPQLRLARRMRFARIVQQEISRRRGIDKDGSAGIGILHNLEELLGTGNQGLQGTARWLYH